MSYDSMWNQTPKTSNDGEKPIDEIPDGDYTAIVEDFGAFQSKAGDWYVSWYLRIDSGVQTGKHVQRFSAVNDRTIGRIKADLDLTLGRIPAWDGELVDEEKGRTGPVRNELVGLRLGIRQRTRRVQANVYRDVYINGVLGRPAAAPETKDEIPEGRWQEERKQTSAPKQRPPEPSKASAPVEDGWGDPNCEKCHGAGCDACASF